MTKNALKRHKMTLNAKKTKIMSIMIKEQKVYFLKNRFTKNKLIVLQIIILGINGEDWRGLF